MLSNSFYSYLSLHFIVLDSIIEDLVLWNRSNSEFLLGFTLLVPSLTKVAAYY